MAYVVPEPAQAPTAAELRGLLKEWLPQHMVPSAFVLLDTLPLLPNGKVDRLALPAPDRTRPGSDGTAGAPRTPVEEVAGGHLGRSARTGTVEYRGQLLRVGRPLVARHPSSREAARHAPGGPAAAHLLRPSHGGRAGRAHSVGGNRGGDRSAPPILPAPRDGELPLSFTQERLWFLHQLDPASQAYHVPATLRFRGPFDLRALQDSLTEMVRRHEVLRTTFPTVRGRPVQRVHQPYQAHLPVVSLEAVSEDREAKLRRLVAEEIRKPFDITRLPLVRWTVMRLGAEDHVMLRVEHHLLGDGWSFHLFLRELLALYGAFSAGRPSPLAEPPIQLADFAHWQRQWMRGAVAEAQLAYWKAKLAGSPPALELPSDRPRPAFQTFRGAPARVELPPHLCASLRRVSRREGVTLFMTMLAAFLTLLRRYTGQSDISVGSVIANRRWRETEGMMGAVLNTVILRGDLSGDPTFRELLRRVRDVTLEAYTHQDVPFDKVVEALRPERSSNYSPFCGVLFNFHDAPLPSLQVGGTSVELTELIDNHSAKFDLNLIVIPLSEQRVGAPPGKGEDGISVNWEYNTDLFDAATIGRMTDHYQEIVGGDRC